MSGHVVAYDDGAWVETETGPVHVPAGKPLPDNALERDVARLADAGLLQGVDAVPAGDADGVVDGTIDEIKVRVGDDRAKALAYLDAERDRDKPRTRLVEHLESVAGVDTGDGPGVTGPPTPSPLNDGTV